MEKGLRTNEAREEEALAFDADRLCGVPALLGVLCLRHVPVDESYPPIFVDSDRSEFADIKLAQ